MRVCIIPARGGSKRFKDKNIAPFFGTPMLLRIIELAKQVCEIVVVSSDSDKILDLAKANALILKRSPNLSDDFTPTLPVIKDALLAFKDNRILNDNKHVDSTFKAKLQGLKDFKDFENIEVMCLYPTAVLASKEEILEGFRILKSLKDLKYVASIAKSNVFRALKLDNNHAISMIFEQYLSTRTQDLPASYIDAGQFYIGACSSFISLIPLLGDKTYGLEVKLAQDIDTELDLKIAHLKLS